MATILGISGSPVANSNTDRLIKLILEETEQDSEFIKLSNYDLHPCQACLGCVEDNICKQNDDWQELEPMLKEAEGFVIGGYAPYDILDAHTKIFIERMYALRHQELLNQGKPIVSIALGQPESNSAQQAIEQINNFAQHEGMDVVASIKAEGTSTCVACGYGTDCAIRSTDKKTINQQEYNQIEEQPQVLEKARQAAQKISENLSK